MTVYSECVTRLSVVLMIVLAPKVVIDVTSYEKLIKNYEKRVVLTANIN